MDSLGLLDQNGGFGDFKGFFLLKLYLIGLGVGNEEVESEERVNKAVKVSHVYHFYSDSQVEFVKHTLIPLEVV